VKAIDNDSGRVEDGHRTSLRSASPTCPMRPWSRVSSAGTSAASRASNVGFGTRAGYGSTASGPLLSTVMRSSSSAARLVAWQAPGCHRRRVSDVEQSQVSVQRRRCGKVVIVRLAMESWPHPSRRFLAASVRVRLCCRCAPIGDSRPAQSGRRLQAGPMGDRRRARAR
jgi:hypothetical protein